jgi:hypothetical protein
MSDPKPSIMAGPPLGICDAHPGVHQRSDGTDRQSATPCVGWMVYEPFVVKPTSDSRMLSPGDRPEAVSELDDDCEHGVFLSTGVKGIWRCTVCDQRATLAEFSEDRFLTDADDYDGEYDDVIYRHTHASNSDFSPVMMVKADPFTIMNENGDVWLADPEEWHKIE